MKGIKSNLALIMRGYKVLAGSDKPVLLSKTLSALFNAGTPFINLYFSARILNELTTTRDVNTLTTLVVITIALNCVAALVKNALNRYAEYCNSMTWRRIFHLYTEKTLSLDYIDLTDPDVKKINADIRQHHNGMGFGLSMLERNYDKLIAAAIKIIISVFAAFSMFSFRVPEGSPYAYLNSPWFIVAMLTTLAMSTLLAPYIAIVGGRVWSKVSGLNNRANRFFGFYFHQLPRDKARMQDVRIYGQAHLIGSASLGIESVTGFKPFVDYFSRFAALSTAVSYLANGLTYLFVAMKALAGAYGVGNIVLYVGAITQFSDGCAQLITTVGEIVNNNPFLEKTFELLDIPNKKYQGSLRVEKREDNQYEIEFKDVSFRYPGLDTYALKHLNLKFSPSRKLAVVGMNGSGKTTMIKLLCRLYDPTDGVITLNGIDIQKYDYDEYMALFSVVFQDFTLLPFTLSQNVAASVNVDEKRAENALNQAGFGERLNTLPNHLETYLYKNFEETGVDVSGGEAQKIALARALYKNAPFVVLDEPTAALDPIAEYEVYSSFSQMVGDKTAVYISHRLASCRFCDEIVVFDRGEMVQHGDHDALLADKNGRYHELFTAQAQYYAD